MACRRELDDDFPLNHLGFHINNIYAVFRDPDMDEHLQEQRGRVYEAEDSPAELEREVVKLLHMEAHQQHRYFEEHGKARFEGEKLLSENLKRQVWIVDVTGGTGLQNRRRYVYPQEMDNVQRVCELLRLAGRSGAAAPRDQPAPPPTSDGAPPPAKQGSAGAEGAEIARPTDSASAGQRPSDSLCSVEPLLERVCIYHADPPQKTKDPGGSA